MKRALLFGGLAGAVLLIGQGEEAPVFVTYREVMIPMRDGVRLQTVLLTPKNAKGALPFLIDRTPYGVPGKEAMEKGLPAGQRWRSENYIFVAQNIRGRFQSRGQVRDVPAAARAEGREGCGRDHRRVGHSRLADQERAEQQRTGGDRGDLLRRVDGGDGRVGPASGAKAAIEQASPADMFLGDDFHHNGAFRLSYGFEYVGDAGNVGNGKLPISVRPRTTPTTGISSWAPLSNANKKYFHGKMPTWTDFVRHPNYDGSGSGRRSRLI